MNHGFSLETPKHGENTNQVHKGNQKHLGAGNVLRASGEKCS
jgi:hypothetical protein